MTGRWIGPSGLLPRSFGNADAVGESSSTDRHEHQGGKPAVVQGCVQMQASFLWGPARLKLSRYFAT